MRTVTAGLAAEDPVAGAVHLEPADVGVGVHDLPLQVAGLDASASTMPIVPDARGGQVEQRRAAQPPAPTTRTRAFASRRCPSRRSRAGSGAGRTARSRPPTAAARLDERRESPARCRDRARSEHATVDPEGDRTRARERSTRRYDRPGEQSRGTRARERAAPRCPARRSCWAPPRRSSSRRATTPPRWTTSPSGPACQQAGALPALPGQARPLPGPARPALRRAGRRRSARRSPRPPTTSSGSRRRWRPTSTSSTPRASAFRLVFESDLTNDPEVRELLDRMQRALRRGDRRGHRRGHRPARRRGRAARRRPRRHRPGDGALLAHQRAARSRATPRRGSRHAVLARHRRLPARRESSTRASRVPGDARGRAGALVGRSRACTHRAMRAAYGADAPRTQRPRRPPSRGGQDRRPGRRPRDRAGERAQPPRRSSRRGGRGRSPASRSCCSLTGRPRPARSSSRPTRLGYVEIGAARTPRKVRLRRAQASTSIASRRRRSGVRHPSQRRPVIRS